jgi:hypothetical protein
MAERSALVAVARRRSTPYQSARMGKAVPLSA